MTVKKSAELPTVESELRRVLGRLAKDEKDGGKDQSDVLREALANEVKKREQRDTNDMAQCLQKPECRRIIQRIIERAQTFALSFSSDALIMAKNEGNREIGMFVMALAESAEPGVCLKMAREAVSDMKAQQAKHEKLLGGEDA